MDSKNKDIMEKECREKKSYRRKCTECGEEVRDK